MFGPLNGVRVALVLAAAAASIAAFVVGSPVAGGVLLAGVGVHGAGWLYLYAKSPERHGPMRGHESGFDDAGQDA